MKSGIGTIAILIDLEHGVSYGYITCCKWKGKVLHVAQVFKDTPFPENQKMFANCCEIEIEADSFKNGIHVQSIGLSSVKTLMEARFVVPPSEHPTYGIKIDTNNCDVSYIAADFSSTPDSRGNYRPSNIFINNGHATTYKQWGPMPNKMPIGNAPVGGFINSAIGLIPRMKQGRFENGMLISDIHNQLIGIHKRGPVTLTCYKGQPDLINFVKDSKDIALVSTDLIVNYSNDLFSTSGNNTHIIANQDAVNDEDYIEIVINTYVNIDFLWIALGRPLIGLKSIQFIGYGMDGVLRDNIWIDIDAKAPSFQRQQEVISTPTSGYCLKQVIIRLIGLLTPNRAMAIHDIGGWEMLGREHKPLINTEGGQKIYRDLTIGDGTWNSSGLLRLEDYRLWIDSSRKLRSKKGVPLSDTDGNIVGA